ncbi:uncharacterized protein TrAFT101_011703 [Trichoderma asperellum]|uniref:uncharacterized protein n=1 Tax=Trichoderma asperellum TaxID=101201 RepID=UPI00331F13D9|nr:hypothetical protein TrAFT101_011703 [Trichoderma asperellum]
MTVETSTEQDSTPYSTKHEFHDDWIYEGSGIRPKEHYLARAGLTRYHDHDMLTTSEEISNRCPRRAGDMRRPRASYSMNYYFYHKFVCAPIAEKR